MDEILKPKLTGIESFPKAILVFLVESVNVNQLSVFILLGQVASMKVLN